MRIVITLGPVILLDLSLFRTEVPAAPNGLVVIHNGHTDDDDDDDESKGMFGGKS